MPTGENRFGIIARWLLEFEGLNATFWSGEHNVTIEGVEYIGVGNVLEFSGAESAYDALNDRLSISIAVNNDEVRRTLVSSTRLYVVLITWVVSTDGGANFQKTKRQYRGMTSNASYSNGVYQIELEPTLGDIDRKQPRKWTDENHRERFPSDVGFGYLSGLVDGIGNARWPG